MTEIQDGGLVGQGAYFNDSPNRFRDVDGMVKLPKGTGCITVRRIQLADKVFATCGTSHLLPTRCKIRPALLEVRARISWDYSTRTVVQERMHSGNPCSPRLVFPGATTRPE